MQEVMAYIGKIVSNTQHFKGNYEVLAALYMQKTKDLSLPWNGQKDHLPGDIHRNIPTSTNYNV